MVKEVGLICFVSDCPIRAFSSGEGPRVLVLSTGFAGVWRLMVLYMSYQVPHSYLGCEFRYRSQYRIFLTHGELYTSGDGGPAGPRRRCRWVWGDVLSRGEEHGLAVPQTLHGRS